MIINSLVILDYEEKTSNKFIFSENQNLIIGEDNTVGKSSIIKSLYYTLGSKNEDTFPKGWFFKNMIFKITYTCNNKEGYIIRNNNLYYVDDSNIPLKNEKYSLWFQKKMNVNYKLSSRNEFLVDARVGALLTPFYIDQDLSWGGKLYKNPSLNMYVNNPIKKIFEELLGLSSNILNELENNKQKLNKIIKNNSNKIDVLSELLDEENLEVSPDPLISIEKKEDYLELLNSLNETTTKFRKNKIKILEKRNKKELELKDLEDIKNGLESSRKDLKKECKICGSKTTIEQLTKQFKLLNNIDDIKYQIDFLSNDIHSTNKEIKILNNNELDLINQYEEYKSILSKDRELRKIKDYLDQQSQYLVSNNIITRRKEFADNIIKKENDLKTIKKDIREHKKTLQKRKYLIKENYAKIFNQIKNDLSSDMDFNVTDKDFLSFSAIKTSGTISNLKKYLVYLVYFNLLDKYSSIKIPCVIDSFVFTEISTENLENMFSAISKYFLSLNSQVFFTILNDNLDYLGDISQYNKITIKKGTRVLSKTNYLRDKEEFNCIGNKF